MASSHETVIDMNQVMELFNNMQKDVRDNGINMFNSDNHEVNQNNMFSYFFQFIRKYVSSNIAKNKEQLDDV
jgi:hypothetical protein